MQPASIGRRGAWARRGMVVTLGIADDALKVRLTGPTNTALDVSSSGTRHVIDAMRRTACGVVVQSSFGVGETRDRMPWLYG